MLTISILVRDIRVTILLVGNIYVTTYQQAGNDDHDTPTNLATLCLIRRCRSIVAKNLKKMLPDILNI